MKENLKKNLIAISSVAILLSQFQSTASADLPPLAAQKPIVVHTQLAAMRSSGTSAEDLLLSLVKETGSLRVMVGLDLDMIAPHLLSEADVGIQAAHPVATEVRSFGYRPDDRDPGYGFTSPQDAEERPRGRWGLFLLEQSDLCIRLALSRNRPGEKKQGLR